MPILPELLHRDTQGRMVTIEENLEILEKLWNFLIMEHSIVIITIIIANFIS